MAVEGFLEELEGVVSAEADYKTGLGTVVYRPAQTGLAEIEDAIRRAGYSPKVLTQAPVGSEAKSSD